MRAMSKKVDKYALLLFEDYQRLLKSHEKAGSGIIAAKTLYHSEEGGLSEAPPPLNKHQPTQVGEKSTAASNSSPAAADTSKATATSAEGETDSDHWGQHWESLHFAK